MKEEWEEDIRHKSSPIEKAKHPAYQRIIGMGTDVIPFIIQDLREGTDHWHWALVSITGANPLDDENSGDMNAIAESWINWWEDLISIEE